jgi:hypothetical protein
MVMRMKDVGVHLTEEEVLHLESKLGFSIPAAFRTFLLQYNGGRPVPSAFAIEGGDGNSYDAIQVFLRHNSPIESSNLVWNNKVTKSRLPRRLFPIARTGCGDYVCLARYGDDAGAVYFWDTHCDVDDPITDHLYWIADSFDEFLDLLQEYPDASQSDEDEDAADADDQEGEGWKSGGDSWPPDADDAR